MSRDGLALWSQQKQERFERGQIVILPDVFARFSRICSAIGHGFGLAEAGAVTTQKRYCTILSESRTLDEIASDSHVSSDHLARECRKQFDLRVGEYARELRLDFACTQMAGQLETFKVAVKIVDNPRGWNGSLLR